MLGSIKKLAVAITFSPTAGGLLQEASRLKELLRAELLLIHVGESTDDSRQKMSGLLDQTGLPIHTKIVWQKGKPAEAILRVCQQEKIDLLITGALKKENIVSYYLSTVARTLMRKAKCSMYVLANPSVEPRPLRNIVINAEDSPFIREAIHTGCVLAAATGQAWVHIVREIKLMGLALSSADQCSEDEYSQVQQALVQDEMVVVEKMLETIPHEGVKINIKILSGKSGFELARFAERKESDLLIVGAPPRKFSLFDRMFPHDLEYIFADLPCNLMIIRPRKEDHRG
jgi:nucleotide-binding universal stress UspA family protein